MKKKLFSLLLVLVLICTPLLCFTGCENNAGEGVHLEVTGTVTVAKGGKFADMQGLKIVLDWQNNSKYNMVTGQYEYCKKADNEKGWEFAGTDPVYFLSGTSTATTTETPLAEAIGYGLTQSGLDTATVGAGKKMYIEFFGKKVEITYEVTETGGGNS